MQGSLELGLQNTRLGERYRAWSKINMSLSELIVITMAGIQVLLGMITVGSLFGFLRAYGAVMQSVAGAANLFPLLASLKGKLLRIQEFIEASERAADTADYQPVADTLDLKDSVLSVESVSFGYGEDLVISKLSFHIGKREKLFLVGPNGCGKSTLAMLLSGLYAPDEGVIYRISGIKCSALVGRGHFYPGSVDTIALKSEDVEYEDFRALARKLEITDCIDQDGDSLSAGQKKRAQIALTLAKQADLYILDEPIANLDEGSRQSVIDTILEYTNNAALLVIEHGEEAFYPRFDRVVRFDYLSQPPDDR